MATTSLTPTDDPASDAAGLLLRVGLAVLGVAVPVAMPWSRRAIFILVPVGAAIVLLAGLLMSNVPIRRRLAAAVFSPAAACGLALIGWVALSLLWSPVASLGVERMAKSAGTLLLAAAAIAFLPERTRTSNLNLFPLGILGAAVVTLALVASGQALLVPQDTDSTLERAVVTMVVLVWPALAAMAIRGRWAAAAIVVVAVVAAGMAAWSTSALVALAIGALGFTVSTGNPLRVGRALGIAAAALIVLGPAVPFLVALLLKGAGALVVSAQPVLQPAADAMRAWADLVVAEPDRLVTGHGLGLATYAPTVGFLPADTPRSLLFELWYDFGLVGAVLTAILVRLAFDVVARLSPTVAPFLIAELLSLLAVVVLGLATTQLWWLTLGGVALLSFATVLRGEYRTVRPLARLEPQVAPLPRGS